VSKYGKKWAKKTRFSRNFPKRKESVAHTMTKKKGRTLLMTVKLGANAVIHCGHS